MQLLINSLETILSFAQIFLLKKTSLVSVTRLHLNPEILNSYPYVLPEPTTGWQPKCPSDNAIRPTINSSIFLDRRLLNDIEITHKIIQRVQLKKNIYISSYYIYYIKGTMSLECKRSDIRFCYSNYTLVNWWLKFHIILSLIFLWWLLWF